MILLEAAKTAAREIATNKVRSVLSFAAISVGVASLLYTLAQTHGIGEQLEKAIELLGPGRLEISAKDNYVSRGLSPGLTSQDAQALREEIPELYMVYPLARSWRESFRHGSKNIDVKVHGVTPEWRKRDWVYTLRGRFLNNWDVKNASRVCVIVEPGGWIKKPFWYSFWFNESPWDNLCAHRDFLGTQIMVADRVLTVVGILREPPKDKDPRWYRWGGPEILVPVTTYHQAIASRRQEGSPTAVNSIIIDTGDEKTLGASKRRMSAVLKRRHRGEEDFELKDSREEIEGEMGEFKKILVASIALGTVALLAGGIGIMNVTLATIFARIKEIGIRRALGASRSDILAQFLLEALFLGLAGGLAGIALGTAGLDYLAKNSDRDIAKLAWYHGLISMAVAAAVSAAFSLYPAYQASRLDPVEALKSE